MKAPQKTVTIRIDDDADANRIAAVLEALGYQVLRELGDRSPNKRLEWAVSKLATNVGLTQREQDVLARVLQGEDMSEIGQELGISKATTKWHMHNIFTKTNAPTRESLLRLALRLIGAESPDSQTEATTTEATSATAATTEVVATEVVATEVVATEVVATTATAMNP